MSFRSRRAFVVFLALLGIVFAVGVTWATSQIVSQRIGLSSEPGSAGLRLLAAPRRPRRPTRTSTSPHRAPAPTTTAPSAPSVPAPSPNAEPELPQPSGGSEGAREGGDRSRSGDD